MVFTKEMMLFLSTMAVVGLFEAILGGAAVYKVGDSDGWTLAGANANVDYHKWASSKVFKIGDVLVFQYDRQQHNVLRVNLSDYHSCNAGNPIAAYFTGNDSITIKGHGHYYYICGVAGHCQAGQKIDIRVPKVSKSTDSHKGSPAPAPALAPAPSEASSTNGPVIAPNPSQKGSASSLFYNNGIGQCLTVIMIAVGFSFVY